jgi:F0F1-type ATP synthase alpha subunit
MKTTQAVHLTRYQSSQTQSVMYLHTFPTNVISITDRPNLFESDLFYSWYSTCRLTVGISVSRVGSGCAIIKH